MTEEFGVQRLIPPWVTTPGLTPGEPYGDVVLVGTRQQVDRITAQYADGTFRVMVRAVVDWEQDRL